MTTPANRFVVGPDAQGRSAVLQRGLTNVQSQEGFYWSATLWASTVDCAGPLPQDAC